MKNRLEGSIDELDPGCLGVGVGVDRVGEGSQVGGHRWAHVTAGEQIEQPRSRPDHRRGRVVGLGENPLGVQRDSELLGGDRDRVFQELQVDVRELGVDVRELEVDGGLGHLLDHGFERDDRLLGLQSADLDSRHRRTRAYAGLLARLVDLPADDQSTDHHCCSDEERP